jgi:protein TonB
MTLDNTAPTGGFAVQTGNSVYGKANTTAVDPNSVKAYRAPKYVPPGGADTDPEVIGDVKIPYPEEAKRADVEGPVRLKITVDFEGHVTEVIVMSGPGYGLDAAAAAALKKFKFRPAMKNGEAVSTTFVYTYRFQLD